MRPLSRTIYEKLCTLLPQGVNSPVRCFSKVGIEPMVVASGHDDEITDCDGRTYIDFCTSWGALILGHANDKVIESVCEQVKKGSTFGITTEVEGKLAEKIIQHVPSIEKIRFVSSGTEATMSAIRLARGYTSKNVIIKFSGHYHGHSDSLLVEGGSGLFKGNSAATSAGIPLDITKNTLSLPFNDIKTLEKCLDSRRFKGKIAAVIIEPIAGNMGVVPAEFEFMQFLRKKTQEENILLIFDEVITGFRIGLNGASHYFGIKPDLITLGKIIGGGFPAAAFGGRKEIMDFLAPTGPVYQAGTLSGNPVAMQAGLATLLQVEKPGVYQELERKTRLLTDAIERKIEEKKANMRLQRVGSMFTLFLGRSSKISNAKEAGTVDLKQFAHFFAYLFERGVYIPPAQHEAWFVSLSHKDEHLIKTSELVCQYIDECLS